MRIDWCWACRREHPMLDAAEFDAVWRDYEATRDGARADRLADLGGERETPRERLLRLQELPRPAPEPGVTARQVFFGPLRESYERVTGLTFEGDDPKVILHYRESFYGPPCPYCGRLLRNAKARQCFECGTDWHDPANVVRRREG
ncbi:MAG TPA: hypothetical protein VF796_20340 [Humisphaera sp.]